MPQYSTARSMRRTLPGHIYTPEGPGRETETIAVPFTPQVLTFTFGGTDPLVAGDYTATFITPAAGSVPVTITSDGAMTFAQAADAFAAAMAAEGNVGTLYTAVSDGVAVVTATAKSGNTSLAVPVTSDPGADTFVAAETTAAAAPSLRLGVFYVHNNTITTPTAVTNTPRGCRLAALPTGATTIGALRGIVARTANQTYPASSDAASAPDAYQAGQIGFGCLRGEVCVVVDPASATIDELTDAVHVVIAAGAYSVIGSVAAADDGANTIRLDNTTPVRARVTAREETFTFGANSGRCVLLKVNQTN